jgi:DNA-binding NtrC family response regulator
MPRPPSQSRTLIRTLEGSRTPIYLLDRERRIVFANEALATWARRPLTELVGLRCEYHTSASVGGLLELAASLCPPPSAWDAGLAAGSVAVIDAQGRLDRREARFVPLPQADAPGELLVAVLGPSLAAPPQAASARAVAQATGSELHVRLQQLRSDLGRRYHIGQLIGQSEAMSLVRTQVQIAAQTGANALIVGPSGSGREHVARTIFYAASGAAAEPGAGQLVPLDGAVIDAEELQAILVAVLRRQAEQQQIQPPTALVLEIDRLSAAAQHELAAFLQLPGIRLRLLATARSTLARRVSRGKFREDLAHAVSPLTIRLPGLARRSEDLPLLAQYFLEDANIGASRQLTGFARPAMEAILRYDWPGNIAELAQAVAEACANAAGPYVQASDLPDRIHLAAGAVTHAPRMPQPIQLDPFLADIERELIERALASTRNNKTRAAQMLGLSRARFLRRMAQLGLAPPPLAEEPIIFEPLDDEP